jgi:tetratricopeptide (TPR) repeat protein
MRLPIVIALCISSALQAQSLQYKSPSGVEYRSRPDTGPVARAQAALSADPRNVEKFIALGVAQAGALQMREAVETFTRALTVAPNDPMLYRWRGHRYISTVQLDRALADLSRGYALDSTNYGILYHLGIVRFSRGEYDQAADMFARAIVRPPNLGELGGSIDWLWMSLMRGGHTAEAAAHLAKHRGDSIADNAYKARRRLYLGEITPAELFTPADTATVQQSTLAYGLGNWYLVRGDTANARAAFERAVKAGGWPGFGYILAEIELRRLTRR